MVVTSRCFTFRALITQARIWKSFWVQNSTSLLYLLIPSSLCQFFSLTQTFWSRNIRILESIFLQNKNWLRVQDFATGKNFSFNQCHNKEFCVFSRGKWFCKSNRELFSCVCIVWYKQTLEGLGELSTVMQTVMQTLDFVSGLHNYLEFSQPLSCLYQAMQSRKTFSIA